MSRLTKIAAGVLALMLAAACGGGEPAQTGGDEGGQKEDEKSLTIAVLTGWAESVAVSNLWKKALEDKGYSVKLQEFSEPGPLFKGLADGDIDLFQDGWLPATHEDYWKKYSSDLEKIGVWYDNAKLTIAVPESSQLKSLEDLKGKGGDYNGTIFGIEKGSGLYRISSTKMVPDYDLKGEWTVKSSSTPAMLTELKKATEAKEDVVVTLWRPHWAYARYPIRDLEDPKGAMGEAEEVTTIGRKGFAEEYPNLNGWLAKFTMDDEQLGALEDEIEKAGAGKEEDGTEKWAEQNGDFIQQMTS